MAENWKPVVGYEGLYEVSDQGRIFSVRRNKILNLKKERDGYIRITLCSNGVEKMYQVHRLVAIAFIPNPDNLPQINHKDEVKSNNVVDNLEWCTVAYNNSYGTRPKRVIETKLKNGTMTGMDPSERMKKYYQDHKEWYKNYKKKWNKLHPEKQREYSRKHRQRKRESV